MAHIMKTLAAVGVGAALFASLQVNAATTTTMSVTGKIIPAACSATLSNNGEVSFGTIAASSIRNAPAGNSLVQLGAKNITLNISCEADTAVGFKAVDNRADSRVTLSSSTFINPNLPGETPVTGDIFGFGLGLASNNAKIGSYAITVDGNNTLADGSPASVILSDDAGSNWRVASDNILRQTAEGKRIITVANSGSSTPLLFREATLPLQVSAGIRTSSVLGSDEINLDGNATLSLVYL